MKSELKRNLTASGTWTRGLFMLLFIVIRSVTDVVVGAVVLLQFIFALVSGTPNKRLGTFGAQLSSYLYQIVMFLTFNTDTKPFPFTTWPEGPMAPVQEAAVAEKAEEQASAEEQPPAATDSADGSSQNPV